MEEPIYNTSFLGNRLVIYSDRLIFKKLWGILGTTTISINQIASVDIAFIGNIIIETTGGQKYAIPFIGANRAKRIQEIISKLSK